MESRVKSHISNKTYISQLEKIEDDDVDAKTECYRLPISGHDIMVAPGKSIMENGIAYCYVYAIQQEKVMTKLGVYEKKTDTMPIFFDLSTFPEGSFCLFEEFEKNPSRLIDLEISEGAENLNIFDYLIHEVYPKIDNPKERLKNAYRSLYGLYTTVKKTNEKEAKQIAPIIKIIKEATEKDKFLYTLKENAKEKKTFVLTLLALQHVFLVKFEFITDSDLYQEILELWPIKDINETVYVDVNSYEKVEKMNEVNLNVEDEPLKETLIDTNEQDTALNNESEEFTIEKPEEKLDFKEEVSDEEFEMDPSNAKDASTREPESLVEMSSTDETPVAIETDLNDETADVPLVTSLNSKLPVSKSATKPKSKPKSVLKEMGTRVGTSLNSIPDTKETVTKPKVQEPIPEESSMNIAEETPTPKTKSKRTTPKSKGSEESPVKSKIKSTRGISKVKSIKP